MTTVAVDELQRAWAAVEAGDFRAGPGGSRHAKSSTRWNPSEPVIAVVGVGGRAGASTVALAIATAADAPARVVECCSMHATGFASATTAELGVDDAGWRRGDRGDVVIERTSASFDHPGQVPLPSPTAKELTVVDVGWDMALLHRADTWLAPMLGEVTCVLVAVATVPGTRALDAALRGTTDCGATWCAVVGPPYKKWPKPVRLSSTPAIDAIRDGGRLLTIPSVGSVAIGGITTQPLPDAIVSACQPILDQLSVHSKGNDHDVQS